LILTFSAAYAALSAAPWAPTRRWDIDRLLQLAQPKPGEKLYELGCGDGRVVVAAAKRYGVKGIGVELSLLQAGVAFLRAKLSKTNTQIKLANLFHVHLRDADIVYLFLMPEAYQRIRAKFEAELKPGARVISYVWPIPEWEPTIVDHKEGKCDLFLYRR